MSELDVLIETRRFLVHNRTRWTKGAYARTAHGVEVAPLDPTAREWCAIGATIKTAGSYQAANHPIHWLTEYCHQTHGMYVTEYQDRRETTHADVITLFDQTINQTREGLHDLKTLYEEIRP